MKKYSALRVAIENCRTKGNREDAKKLLSLMSTHSEHVSTLDEIAYLQNELHDYDNCEKTLTKCLELTSAPSELAAIRKNLTKINNFIGKPLKSIEHGNYALAILDQKEEPDVLMEIALGYYFLNQRQKSKEIMLEILKHPYTDDHIKKVCNYNLASFKIDNGDFVNGYKEYIEHSYELNLGGWHNEVINASVQSWNGTVVKDQKIFILGYGGIGDEILYARFTKNIAALGMKPIWVSHHDQLVDVFNRNGIPAITDKTFRKDLLSSMEGTTMVPSMFVPIILKITEKDLWNGPYIKPSNQYIKKWKKILPEGKKLAVKWSGNVDYDHNVYRSIPIDMLRQLEFDGTLINLQLEKENNQDDMFNPKIEHIEDTLAIISLCDSMVSSCTGVVHMAGSMGKNAVVCASVSTFFAWLDLDGYKSHWYDESLKVHRQQEVHDWDIADEIKKLI